MKNKVHGSLSTPAFSELNTNTSGYDRYTRFKIAPYNILGDIDGSLHLEWVHRPISALVIEKIRDKEARKYLRLAAQYLVFKKSFKCYAEKYLCEEETDITYIEPFISNRETPINMIIAFGGDGTLLHISSIFPEFCPPILVFAMGSLGFLSPFLAQNYEQDIDDMIRGYFFLNSRTRLTAEIIRDGCVINSFHCLNDIVIRPTVTTCVCALESKIDGEYFSTVYGDGLIISTSTGSTAYNLSAGGAMIHPSVSTILFTPICAHSLNAHPIVLPDCVILSCKIAYNDRTGRSYEVSYDSKKCTLTEEDEIFIRISTYPLPTVCKDSPVSDWLGSISTVLKWNQPITNTDDESVMISCSTGN